MSTKNKFQEEQGRVFQGGDDNRNKIGMNPVWKK